jgi:hypothetical protein
VPGMFVEEDMANIHINGVSKRVVGKSPAQRFRIPVTLNG